MKPTNLLFILFFTPVLLVAQHSIKATFTPPEYFNWAILYQVSSAKNNYVAQAKINEGKVEFKLDSAATKGIYKLVYAAPQDQYNFDIIYNGEEDIELTFNINNGVVFQKSVENKLLSSYLTAQENLGLEIEQFYVEKNTDTLKVLSLFQNQRTIQKEYEERTKNMITHHFIIANKPYIPENYEDPETYINNITANYFTNIDFNNPVLQSSNFLASRSFAYITGVLHPGKDKISSYNTNIDTIVSLLGATEANFRKPFLESLWQKSVNYNLTDAANYLATKHLIPIAISLEDEMMVNKLTKYKRLSIGNIAPDFSWEIETDGKVKTQKLSELALAENYILVFWSSSCSHCLEEIPKLNLFTQSLDKTKYKVIAVGLEDNPIKWENETIKYPNFINVLKLQKWENEIIKIYSLETTPTYFVLDKDKRFLAKPKNFEELKLYLEK